MKYAILWYSIGKSDCTFGQKLLSAKYDNITFIKKMLLALDLFVEYLLDKMDSPSNDTLIQVTLAKLNDVIQLCRFLNISIFLRNGVRPRLMERILSLDLSYDSSKNIQQQYDSQYMTRELLWDSFIVSRMLGMGVL